MARKQSTNRSPGSARTPKGFTQGNTLIDPNTGDPICVKEDAEGQLRLCVDASLTANIGDINVDLDFVDDSVHIGNPTSGNVLVIESDGSLNVNVKVDAKDGDNVAISGHPSANHIKTTNTDSLTLATSKEIFSYTSTSDNTRIQQIKLTAATPCKFELKIDGVVEEVLRSSPTQRNIKFQFEEHLALLNGKEITVDATPERFFNNRQPYDTFTKLEGYLCT